jgi:glycosyltransferase involved in cell wall biosynthesis
MNPLVTVSVLVPTYNGANKLPTSLGAVAGQTILPHEVCVVVDGSTDHTVSVLNEIQLLYPQLSFNILFRANGGRALAKNSAISQANGDLLVFLDDDMEPTSDWLASHIEHHARIKGSIASGCLCPPPRAFPSEIFKYQKWLHHSWEPKSHNNSVVELSIPYVHAGNFSVHKQTLLSLGAFRHDLTDCEDRLLAIHAQKSLIPLFLLPSAVCIHHDTHGSTFSGMVIRAREYEKARLHIYGNSCSLQSRPELLPFVPKRGFRTIYKFLSHPFWVTAVDINLFVWLPEKIRFRIYNAILTASSRL